MAAKTQPLQTSFSSGVLNPGLMARTDIEHYFQGAKTGSNVLFVKEGGARGRWGLQHLVDTPAPGRLLSFSFNTEQNYLLWAGNLQIRFLRDDALVTNINGSGLSYLATTYTLAQCLELDYTQSADTMVLTHVEVAPTTLVRGATHATWTIAAAALSNLPKYDFNDGASPVPTSHVVDMVFNTFTVGDRYKLELNDFETPEIVYADSATASGRAANARRIKEELLELPPTGFTEASITVAWTAGSTYRITFLADSADAYEPMSGRNTDRTTATIGFTVIALGVPRREDVISATRGWPRSVTFYESRLFFGGTFSLPQSLLGTVIGGFNPYNFKLGDGLDNQGIFTTLNNKQVNEIRALYPGRALQVFTSGGEFYSPDRPVTPAMTLPGQTEFGTCTGIRPVAVDGATIFPTKLRKTLREFLFTDKETAYNASSLTVLADHLIKGLVSLDAQTSTSTEEQSYVLVVNADGTAAVLNTLRAQDIAAWAEMFTRDGDNLLQVCVVGETIYFHVQRQRNGATVYTIEKATFDTRLDAAKKITSGFSLAMGGFEHLAGETVQVLVDGSPIEDKLVSAAGVITLEDAPTVSIEAGYFVPPVLETMPLVVSLGGDPLLGASKSLSEIRIAVKDSLGIVANGELIPDQVLGEQETATPGQPVSGLLKIGDLGWSEGDVTITLTQRQPLPFHVLAVAGVLHVGRS